MRFIEGVRECIEKRSLKMFDGCDGVVEYQRKWQTLVYFQIRYFVLFYRGFKIRSKEILNVFRGIIEMYYQTLDNELKEGGKGLMGCLMESVRVVWNDSVYILGMNEKFIGLTLNIVEFASECLSGKSIGSDLISLVVYKDMMECYENVSVE